MNRKQKAFRLSDTAISMIEDYKKSNGIKTDTEAVEKIIVEHHNKSQEYINDIAGAVVAQLDNKYADYLTRVRLGVNTADINSQIIIEILNSLLFNSNCTKSFTTSSLEHDIVKDSRKEIKDKIAYYKQLKNNKAKK